MSENEIFHIWPSSTGIADLPEDWAKLSVSVITDIIPVWRDAQEKLKSTDRLQIFNDRLAREWAIETGVIEDVFHIENGTTVTLIEQGLSSALIEHGTTDKPADYVINILLDHVQALEWLVDSFVTFTQPMSVLKIKELHSLLTAHQPVVDVYSTDPQTGKLIPAKVPLLRGKWKERSNNVSRGGVTYEYCDPIHVDEEMAKLVAMHEDHQAERVSAEVSAAWLHHRFTQIHPFHDGNGRVARALASLIFIQAGLFPLVINRGKMREAYISALEEADAGDLNKLIILFAEAQQSRFDQALNIADSLVKPPKTVELAIDALKNRYAKKQDEVASKQRSVFVISKVLEREAKARFDRVSAMLAPIDAHASVYTVDTSHYYRGQIIDLAREFGYYANTTAYRTWVKLVIGGDSPAQLILSFHGRGSEFAGVMVCIPIFELIFAPNDDGGPTARTQIPVADHPFEFYFTEKAVEVKERFAVWLDETIALALSQLQRNL